jgi:hypothetical protein
MDGIAIEPRSGKRVMIFEPVRIGDGTQPHSPGCFCRICITRREALRKVSLMPCMRPAICSYPENKKCGPCRAMKMLLAGEA